ncbi:MAG: hypothetical protein ACK46X_13740, partial [Candidatus Sericytochromatia bacterium]
MQDFFDRFFGARRRVPPPPPAPPAEPGWEELPVPEPGDAPIDWMAEMAREMAFEQGATARPFGQAAPAERRYSSAAGFEPGMVPPDFDSYRALLHEVFDPARRRLGDVLANEPYCRAAFDGWRPGRTRENLNILYTVFERVSATMGTIYRFHPAPLGYSPGMGDAIGQYNRRHVRVMLSERLLHDRVEELFATVIHEQIHKLQHEMTLRLDFATSHPLSLPERSLAYYWVREEPRVSHYYTRAWNDIKEGRG